MSSPRFALATKPVLEFVFEDADEGINLNLSALLLPTSWVTIKDPGEAQVLKVEFDKVGVVVDTSDSTEHFVSLSFKDIAGLSTLKTEGKWIFNFFLDYATGSTGTNQMNQFEIEVIP